MELKGKEFILRHFKMSDAQRYFESKSTPEARKGFMSVLKNLKEAKKSVKKRISQYKQKKPKGEAFVIEVNGEFAGYIEIHSLNEKFHEHKGKLSYCIHPKFKGKGIMLKALKLLTAYAFKKYKLKRISGWCRTFNKKSAKLLEKAGYKLEGILRKNKKKNGKYLDDMIWAKVK